MTKEEAFVNELIGYIFAYPYDDYMTMECLCRKLHKYGLIERKDGEWTCDFVERADTPQTDCDTCRYGQDKHRYAHICNECGVGINNYTPQTESTGSPIGDYRDGVGAWQTDCGWK